MKKYIFKDLINNWIPLWTFWYIENVYIENFILYESYDNKNIKFTWFFLPWKRDTENLLDELFWNKLDRTGYINLVWKPKNRNVFVQHGFIVYKIELLDADKNIINSIKVDESEIPLEIRNKI